MVSTVDSTYLITDISAVDSRYFTIDKMLYFVDSTYETDNILFTVDNRYLTVGKMLSTVDSTPFTTCALAF